uniref:Uncharacterized protein n=1 Tax=Timema genevievae TaxID=629358 RepID=A0A7R9K5K1_TIMGE|nr:unnamed protein product [Timema genevievae]
MNYILVFIASCLVALFVCYPCEGCSGNTGGYVTGNTCSCCCSGGNAFSFMQYAQAVQNIQLLQQMGLLNDSHPDLAITRKPDYPILMSCSCPTDIELRLAPRRKKLVASVGGSTISGRLVQPVQAGGVEGFRSRGLKAPPVRKEHVPGGNWSATGLKADVLSPLQLPESNVPLAGAGAGGRISPL